MQQAQKRWDIHKTSTADDAMNKIKTEKYDLLVLDQELNDDRGIKGTDVASYARKNAVDKNCIIVLNSASITDLTLKQGPQLYNLLWPKPLPSESWMRQSLCEELIQQMDDKSTRRSHT